MQRSCGRNELGMMRKRMKTTVAGQPVAGAKPFVTDEKRWYMCKCSVNNPESQMHTIES